jgi:hypothetical protein
MFGSLLLISHGGVGYRIFTDPRLKNLSISTMVMGTIGVLIFIVSMDLKSSSRLFDIWLVIEMINVILWSVLYYYLYNFTEIDLGQKNSMIFIAGLGSIGVAGLIGGLIHFRRKRVISTELGKVRQVYDRLTSNV